MHNEITTINLMKTSVTSQFLYLLLFLLFYFAFAGAHTYNATS